MIVRKNKDYAVHSSFPDINWEDDDSYIIDETTEEGKLLANKIKEHSPYFDFILDIEGNLIGITPTEKPLLTTTEPTQDDYLLDLDFRLSMIELGL